MESVELDRIRIDGGTQPRAMLDMIVVADYAQAMKEGANFPPVTVFYDGADYWLADGFHRHKAAAQLGNSHIEADIRQGTLTDAQWHSFSANKSHGLRRETKDKERAVKAALLHPRGAGLSNVDIARHCGVDEGTVRKWRAALESSSEIPKIATRVVNRGGRSYSVDTTRIGKPVTPPIAPQAALLLVNTPVADDKREQEKIARLDEPQQEAVAQQIAAGEAATVSEALILQARYRTPEPAITPPLPQGQYRCIVIDPPWPVKKIEREERPNQGQALDYPTMTLEEIAALPVKDFAYQDGCHLYLWVTQKYLPEGLRLMEAWGFRYQCVMTWVKPTGITPYSWMYNTEHILFGRVGNLPLAKLGLKLSLDAPVTGHSVKPDVFFDRVIQASPGPRLEMFARRAREGFEVWGNEVAA